MKLKLYLLILSLLVLTAACANLRGSLGGIFGGREGAVGGQGVILKFTEAPENNEEINEGYPFNVRIEIENHVVSDAGLIGELCLRDSLSSNYAGIPDNDCRSVNLPSATKIESKVTPSIDSYSFGPYSYQNLEKELTQDAIIFADLKYEVESTAGATACVKQSGAQSQAIPPKCGEKQDLQIQQTDLPIKISKLTSKSSASNFEARVDLEILLTKVATGQVTTKENVLNQQTSEGTAQVEFDVSIDRVPATCSGLGNNKIEFRQNENEKIVKCYAQISLNQDFKDAPIIIKTGYGFIQRIPGRTIKLVKGGIL